MVLEWCWSGLEWRGIMLEGVKGCWSGVGVVVEWVGVAWNHVGGC